MGDRTSKRHVKIPVAQGYSQLHWMGLTNKVKNFRNGSPIRHDITLKEVSEHNSEEDAWTVFEGKVYNITPYLKYHPGGVGQLMLGAGGDCTELFFENHKWVNGHGMLEACYLGKIADDYAEKSINTREEQANSIALDATQWKSFELIEKHEESTMTYLFRFGLPKGTHLGLEHAGQHVMIRANVDGVLIERPYTPVTSIDQEGYFDLIIKLYPDGRMSQYLSSLKVGNSVSILGPRGAFGYLGEGLLHFSPSISKKVKYLGIIAGGSGITVMLQILRKVFNNPKDKTVVSLIFCNHSEDYIIARNTLDSFKSHYAGRFRLHHVLSNVSEFTTANNAMSTIGHINSGILRQHLPSPSDEVCIFHAGPPKFDIFIKSCLDELGYRDQQIHMF